MDLEMLSKRLGGRLALCCLVLPVAAMAQEAADAPIEEIIVTGSLIRGTPEDAALPVEVFDFNELRESGSPTALEFAKRLTYSGPITGEAYYFSDAQFTGNVSYNLRGIGADKTLSLFNGRRISQNTSIIPSIALERIEVLKDGAAVTYGADATGGVINFITRDHFEGIEVEGSYMAIDGSDGDHKLQVMGGFGGDRTNVLWAAEWEHRSELDSTERSWAFTPYSDNPAPWSGLTNLARWFAHGIIAPPADPTDELGPVDPDTGAVTPAPIGEYGTLLGLGVDFSQESCEAVNGVYTGAACNYNYIPYYNLVEDNDIYRLYGQVNSAVNDNMEFYLRLGFARVYTPYAYGSPSQPVVRGPSRARGLVGQFYVPRTNPGWDEFASRSGLTESPFYGLMHGATAITYRAFAHGGNDIFASGGNHSTPREIDNKYWHASTGFQGMFANDIGYDFGITYNHIIAFNDNPDIIASRLQQALNGFGGPDCNAADLDPGRFGTQNAAAAGTDGCMWFNPFASNFAGQPALGLSNPNYGGPTAENSPELIRWLFDKREEETVTDSITVDLIFNGDTPLELPGGTIAWASGLQWRLSEQRETVESDFYNGSQPCVWPASEGQVPRAPDDPLYNGCTAPGPGPFQFFGTNPPDRNEQDQESIFVEVNFPLFDSLNLSAAGRHERFYDGDLDATVYKVFGQWEATQNLSFRGSYGTNYQAPPITVVPGEIVNGVNSYTIAGNQWLGATTVTREDIEPETATVWSAGVIWQSRGFTEDSSVRLIVDYFDIETEDELGLLASANDIANSVFSPATRLADCDHPLIQRVTFNGGVCQQGVTSSANFASITTDFGNGPGQHTTGFDIQAGYSFPLADGFMSFDFTATRITKLENEPAVLDGFQIDDGDDRLGDLNFEVIGQAASKWRANLSANYARGIHNVRFMMHFVSGVDDERFINEDGSLDLGALTPAGFQPGTLEPFGPSDWGVKGDDWISADLHYKVELPWETEARLSIQNITDEDPPESRQELGYDPRIGFPLGRTFELGVTKRFGVRE